MTASEWVTVAIIVAHFTGLVVLCWRDPSNLGGRR